MDSFRYAGTETVQDLAAGKDVGKRRQGRRQGAGKAQARRRQGAGKAQARRRQGAGKADEQGASQQDDHPGRYGDGELDPGRPQHSDACGTHDEAGDGERSGGTVMASPCPDTVRSASAR
ncbi:hypothetical protein [Micromonospora sp. NPDC048839]|uniref:hypothetical protein n=1 Tax=Micromonospora sp. NPDC048839 TaxID=3155641 RepID=UPI0033F27DBC